MAKVTPGILSVHSMLGTTPRASRSTLYMPAMAMEPKSCLPVLPPASVARRV